MQFPERRLRSFYRTSGTLVLRFKIHLEEGKLMKGFAMLKIGSVGWIEKDRPKCGPMDAI